MRILSVTNDIDSGGAAKSLFFLAQGLARLGHEVRVISISAPSRTGRRVEELDKAGVAVDFVRIPYYPMSLAACPIPFWKNVGRALSRPGEFRRIRRLVRAFGPDVIHYNSYTTLLAALPLAGFPAVLHCREMLLDNAPLLPLTKPLVHARVRELAAISPAEAEQARRVFGLEATVVFNPAPVPDAPAPMPEASGKGGGLIYGMFSHVSPTKGHRLCIEACGLAARELRRAGVRVRLFGGRIGLHDGLYRSLERMIADAGLGDVVSFQGFAVDPEAEMRAVHLVLRPDLTGHPWGRDVIEAMSQGRPVLAAGTSEVFIKPGETGELVPPGDAEALAAAMVGLADRDRLARMGENAHRFAAARFDPDEHARSVLAILKRAARRAS
jgi:glycosyltransferase involved in cell wall biosynthesis